MIIYNTSDIDTYYETGLFKKHLFGLTTFSGILASLNLVFLGHLTVTAVAQYYRIPQPLRYGIWWAISWMEGSP